MRNQGFVMREYAVGALIAVIGVTVITVTDQRRLKDYCKLTSATFQASSLDHSILHLPINP